MITLAEQEVRTFERTLAEAGKLDKEEELERERDAQGESFHLGRSRASQYLTSREVTTVCLLDTPW
jgi:hypothetical protein